MEQSKYIQLREELRQFVAKREAELSDVEKFIGNVAERVSRQHNLEQVTCRAGVQRGGNFVAKKFDREGPKVHFAFEVKFHHRDGSELLNVVVEFVAEIVGELVEFAFADGRKWVRCSIYELAQESPQLQVAKILDEEVEDTVGAVVGKGANATE